MLRINAMGGWIKLHRQLTEWEWYQNTNTKCLFIHCLLRANHEDKRWQGVQVKRGSFISSYAKLSSELRLSVRQIRVSLEHLKVTGEMTSVGYPQYSLFTVVNYDQFQADDKQNDKRMTSRMTNERQTNDKRMTTNKNEKNEKNEKKLINTASKKNAQEKIRKEEVNSITRFESQKSEILVRAIRLYPNSNCEKAIEDFLEYCKIKGPSYKDYELAYYRWIRTDLRKEYGNAPFRGFDPTLRAPDDDGSGYV